MAKNNNLTDFLKNLADKFRSKLSTSTLINPQDFESSVDSVYNKGKTDEYNAFWDTYQLNGNRRDYAYAFYTNSVGNAIWTNENFKPKYDLVCSSAGFMFRGSHITGDLDEILEQLGVILDTSQAVSFNYFAYFSKSLTHITVDMSSGTSSTSAFGGCSGLTSLNLSVNENLGFSYTFDACTSLNNLHIDSGLIGNNINLSSSPLINNSIENIVEHLSSSASGKTITLKKAAVESAFTDDEWQTLIATKPNWTFALL